MPRYPKLKALGSALTLFDRARCGRVHHCEARDEPKPEMWPLLTAFPYNLDSHSAYAAGAGGRRGCLW